VSSYLGYAFRILNQKSSHNQLTIRATGNAIVKALILIELVKRRIGDLHQLNKIHSTVIVDVYKPKVEGLEQIEQNRRVTALDCILSKVPLDKSEVGYQEPEPKEERVQHP
jgi:DNA-binding protein